MAQQALELRIELVIVADALEIVLLRRPFDSENDERHAQRTVRQHRPPDFLRWANGFAIRDEALIEFLGKFFEQVNVFRLFTGELQKRSRAIVVLVQVRSYVVQHERKNEFFDQTERVEIAVSANLIEEHLLVIAQEFDRIHTRERVGHERFGEIEALVAADDVFDSPVRLDGRCQRVLIVVCGYDHSSSIQSVCSKHCGSTALQLESCGVSMAPTMLMRPKKLTRRPG